MAELESKITAWRNEMLAAGISLDAVAELESHLRDDVARQIKSGIGENEAFDSSVRQLGKTAELQIEFQKFGSRNGVITRVKNAVLSFAGIPNHPLIMNDAALKLDSRWTTYLRSVLFLLPALVLWSMAAIYVTPQFTSLWQKACTYNDENIADFTKFLRFDSNVMYLLKDNVFWLAVFGILALGLLEWRSDKWPRYRRAVMGAGVFLVNFVVLFSFAVMFLAATLAATQLAVHAK
jgi:hypothetical protein